MSNDKIDSYVDSSESANNFELVVPCVGHPIEILGARKGKLAIGFVTPEILSREPEKYENAKINGIKELFK